MNTLSHDVLVLGIGNLLWADEGFGVRCVEAFDSAFDAPDNVLVMDGGTQGLYLLPYVEAAKKLVVFDAIDFGFQPGTLKQLEGRDVPAFMGAKKMSLHQTGFQEVLAVARLRGWAPEAITLIGCQPAVLEDYGGSLSESVRDRIPEVLVLALDTLYGWMARPERRTEPPGEEERITLDSLDMAVYEGQRPSAKMACRMGDDRFLASIGSAA